MGNENLPARRTDNSLAILKGFLADDSVKKRFENMLGERAGAFTNSVISVFQDSNQLQKCTPKSICSAAIRAATLNMPIDKALGFAAIVPYGNTANFQLMYKGVTQLCIRSNQYRTIHCTEIYADEIDYYNPVTAEIAFNDPEDYKMRRKGDPKNIVGHYAHFELLSGFVKSDYMTTDEAMAHGKKYSKAYQYDLKDKKKSSLWSTNPVVMCNKTVLLRLLTKYGVMSIELQDAIIGERKSFDQAEAEASEDIGQQQGSEEIIDADLEPEKSTTKAKAKRKTAKSKKTTPKPAVEDDNWRG